MLAKKRTNAVGASLACGECAVWIAQCGWTLANEGPEPFRNCLVHHGVGECVDCGHEITNWMEQNAGGGGSRPLPRDFGRDIH